MHTFHAADVKARLCNQIEQVLPYLFPSGKVVGHEFCIGDATGTAGKSLKVEMRGPKTGVWCDFSSGDAGDLLDLWMRAKAMDFGAAFRDACQYLGLNNITPAVKKPKPPPPPMDDVGALKGTPVHRYLNSRGIADKTLIAYRVKSHFRPSPHNTDFILFQFWDTESVHLKNAPPTFIKSTGLNKRPDGSKDIWSTTPFYTLFGWWLVKPSDRAVIITEGEVDAMSMSQLESGMPVLSMPSGASNLTWIDNDFDALRRFERIYIATDMDEAGERCAVEMSKRLGQTRCFRLPVPGGFKDANECQLNGAPELWEWASWVAGARTYDPATLRSVSSLADEAKRRVQQWDAEDAGPTFCLPELAFSIRNGESTLIAGISTHGKSELSYQALLQEMKNGHKVCIASFEIDASEMLTNLAHQLVGHKPKTSDIDKAVAWLSEKLWFYYPKEDAKNSHWSPMLTDFQYANQRFGCRRFLIDSLLFVTKKDDFDAQDQFCKDVRDFDRQNDTHTFVIAHCSTKQKENEIPGVAQIQGSSGIIAPFSNVLIVWRNMEKEEKLADAKKASDSTEVEKAKKVHDGMILVKKQRRTGKHPKVKVWFSSESRTFRTSPEIPPKSDNPEMF